MRSPHFRFQHWIMLMATTLVVTLTAIYLVTVFGKFTAMSERDAQARFALISQRAANEVSALVEARRDNCDAFCEIKNIR